MRRAGFTMVELLLALGLFSLLIVGVLQLFGTSTDLWRRVEQRRAQTEISGALGARLERDLATLEAGLEGDFLGDWTTADVDGDGIAGLALARLRFVRRAAPREVARLAAAQAVAEPKRSLVEVAWILVPAPGKPFEGRLLRAERFLDDPERTSLLDPRILGVNGQPAGGLFDELSSEVLWMGMDFDSAAAAGATSWDGWGRQRPDVETCGFNAFGGEQPRALKRPLLPQRVRITFEVQPQAEKRRRTTLQEGIGHDTQSFAVFDERRLPEPGGLLLIDEEWVELVSIGGRQITVRRGARGSLAVPHSMGATLQFGWRTEVELPIALAREEWL